MPRLPVMDRLDGLNHLPKLTTMLRDRGCGSRHQPPDTVLSPAQGRRGEGRELCPCTSAASRPPALSDQDCVAGQRPQPTPPRPSLSQKGIILGTRDGENPSSLREPWESPVLRQRLGVQLGTRGHNKDSSPETGGSGGQEIPPGVGFWSKEQAYRLPH